MGLFFSLLNSPLVLLSKGHKHKYFLLKLLIITILISLVSACGYGAYEENNQADKNPQSIKCQDSEPLDHIEESAINAVDVINKCQYLELSETRNKQPVTFKVVENVAHMQGIMDSTIPHLVANLINRYPEVDTIVMNKVLGTIDFSATLEAGQLVRAACLSTVVPYRGKIASGGVYFFLAGCDRIVESGADLGVHTWKRGVFDDEGNLTQSRVASEYSITDPVHNAYLNYQFDMGIPEEFYWFTVNTPFDNVHYLSHEEMAEFNINTVSVKTWGADYRLAVKPELSPNFDAARFYVKNAIATMHGSIGSRTPTDLRNMLLAHPEVHTLEFGFVPGTISPLIRHAVELGYVIRQACLKTKIGQSSYVLTSAIHSFIAGCDREFETGGQLEIASWYDADPTVLSESEFINNEIHAEYLNYYDDMGIPRSFYSYQLTVPNSNPEPIDNEELKVFGII